MSAVWHTAEGWPKRAGPDLGVDRKFLQPEAVIGDGTNPETSFSTVSTPSGHWPIGPACSDQAGAKARRGAQHLCRPDQLDIDRSTAAWRSVNPKNTSSAPAARRCSAHSAVQWLAPM